MHSDFVIRRMKTLRRKGMSIPEIVAITGIPKTTVWHNVHTIVLRESDAKRIKSRQGGSTLRSQKSWRKANDHAQKILNTSKGSGDLPRLVAMLYWAEGSKGEMVFTNTDIHMIQLYLIFLFEILKINPKEVSLLIRISDPIVPVKALNYWSRLTKISKARIKINHNNLQNKTKTRYGICRVSLKKGGYSLKVIYSMIDAIKKEFLRI